MMPGIATTITETRHRLRLTQQEVAELSGVSVRLIREVEAGRANPGLRQLERIVAVLNLTLTLVPGTNEAASR